MTRSLVTLCHGALTVLAMGLPWGPGATALRADEPPAPTPPPPPPPPAPPPAAPDDDLLRDDERYEHAAAPAFVVERPDREWAFVNLAVLKRVESASGRPLGDVEAEFRALRCRLHHPRLKANFSAFVFPLAGGAGGAAVPDAAALRESTIADIRRGLPDAQVSAVADATIGGRPCLVVEYAGTPSRGEGGAYVYTRVVCVRADASSVVLFLFEAPKAHAKAAGAGLKKILKKLRP